jgi:hypothetical protein
VCIRILARDLTLGEKDREDREEFDDSRWLESVSQLVKEIMRQDSSFFFFQYWGLNSGPTP